MDKLSHDIDNFLHDILVNEWRYGITDIENYIRLFFIGSVLLSFLCFLAPAFVVYDDFLRCRSLDLDYGSVSVVMDGCGCWIGAGAGGVSVISSGMDRGSIFSGSRCLKPSHLNSFSKHFTNAVPRV